MISQDLFLRQKGGNIKCKSQVISISPDGPFERINQMEQEVCNCKGQKASPLFFAAKTVNDAL